MAVINKSGMMPWGIPQINLAPNGSGVYALHGLLGNLLYVGRAGFGRLRARLLEHWSSNNIPGAAYFEWAQTTSEMEAQTLEKNLILSLRPLHNQKIG